MPCALASQGFGPGHSIQLRNLDGATYTCCMHDATVDESDSGPKGRALEILLESYRSFLRFLERRVGSREAAEDILQDAFTRNLATVSYTHLRAHETRHD